MDFGAKITARATLSIISADIGMFFMRIGSTFQRPDIAFQLQIAQILQRVDVAYQLLIFKLILIIP